VKSLNLETFFQIHPRVAIGLSGGVDSSYLLHMAQLYAKCVHAYFVKTEFQPTFELHHAQDLASDLGADLTIIEISALSIAHVAENTKNRCYFCKQGIFSCILSAAKADGYDVILDGTNADDDLTDRKGAVALEELKVLSPLRLCGITKADIRQGAKEAGLFVWNKPAYACLATRVPTGMTIHASMLKNIECAEGYLYQQGFTDFRVRLTEAGALIQVLETQMDKVLAQRDSIIQTFSPLFDTITLDLRGR